MAKSCCSLYVAFSATSFFCVTISVFTQCCFLPALHLSSFAFMLRSRPLSFFARFVPSHFSLFSSPLILRSSRPLSFFGHFKSCSFPVRSKSRLAFLPSHLIQADSIQTKPSNLNKMFHIQFPAWITMKPTPSLAKIIIIRATFLCVR